MMATVRPSLKPFFICDTVKNYVPLMSSINCLRDDLCEKKSPIFYIFGLEYEDIYTAGPSVADSKPEFVVNTDRGGLITYHGLGQLVVYFVAHVASLYSAPSVREFINDILNSVSKAIEKETGAKAIAKSEPSIGIFLNDLKIASVGFKFRRWTSSHGVAININTDLEKFLAIDPCGLSPKIMSSLFSEGYFVTKKDMFNAIVDIIHCSFCENKLPIIETTEKELPMILKMECQR